jgi:hypothetical protein
MVEDEEPYISRGTTVGIYTLTASPGEYILEIKREGYVVRWAKIVVTSVPVQYLGHREIIAGDINENRTIDAADADAIQAKIGAYWNDSGNYEAKYDLNSDGKIDQLDYNIVVKFLNFNISHYVETEAWITELGY